MNDQIKKEQRRELKDRKTKIMYVYAREEKVYLKYILKTNANATCVMQSWLIYVCIMYMYILWDWYESLEGGTDSSRASISKVRSTMVQFCPFSFDIRNLFLHIFISPYTLCRILVFTSVFKYNKQEIDESDDIHLI